MIVLRIVPVLISLGLVSVQVHADPTQPAAPQVTSASAYSVDLMGLYREARLEDPRMLSAYLHAQSAVDSERDAFSGLLPQVTANGSQLGWKPERAT